MNTSGRKINCPNCQILVEWSETNPYRPFCSQRCKLIDFGDWANERHAIPGETFIPEEEDPDVTGQS